MIFAAIAATLSIHACILIDTPLQVQDICFSGDSRWVGVSTLNGTTHVFPLSPYGGEITVRTHTPRRVVNKMSRFHTTAGIGLPSQAVSSTGTTAQTSRSSQSPPLENREIPSVAGGNGLTVMSNSWNNPRALPLPCPVVVNALQQIKQPYVSTSGEGEVHVCVTCWA